MEKMEQSHTHPSFGLISFNRINGTNTFYGSELKQDNYIEMTVKNSEIVRELTHDYHYPIKGLPLIKVRMSANQFSELITSMNIGEGVCCTVEVVDGKHVTKLPDLQNRKEFVHNSFEDRMQNFTQTIKEEQKKALALVKKKTLSKDDVQNLTNYLEWLTTEIDKNIPFIAKCFQETMDTIVQEAKLDVENAIQHKINVLGLDQLHKQNKLLAENNDQQSI